MLLSSPAGLDGTSPWTVQSIAHMLMGEKMRVSMRCPTAVVLGTRPAAGLMCHLPSMLSSMLDGGDAFLFLMWAGSTVKDA